ncbi:hypothetical protein [uncultured Helicobacter sp.]|uniref:hypothetical protein n=1 Tax=uncultured Helicobacter sp. TaxID=175537 RepID=UPI0026EC7A91|nr:hypothetical protein [uncultured Helicobacter sp.]
MIFISYKVQKSLPQLSLGAIPFFDFEFYVDYYIAGRKYDKPLYMSTGYKRTKYANNSGNTSVFWDLPNVLLIKVRGNIALNSTWIFEYPLAYDIGLSATMVVIDDSNSKYTLSTKSGYGLRLNTRARYYVSKNIFYIRMFMHFKSNGQVMA